MVLLSLLFYTYNEFIHGSSLGSCLVKDASILSRGWKEYIPSPSPLGLLKHVALEKNLFLSHLDKVCVN